MRATDVPAICGAEVVGVNVDVLVVEDDGSIAEPLVAGLRREGFAARAVHTGTDALAASGYDIALVDLGLPDMDGYDVCRRIRASSDVPIIVITARGDEVDRVVGLELGADDYMVKPFGFRELVARIRAILRRARVATDRDVGPIRVGALEIDERSRRVTLEGKEIALSPKEFDLLLALAADPGAAVRRDRIMDEVWDTNWYGSTRTLDFHVGSLRRKLGDPAWIETVRGVGFRLRPPA